MLAEQIGQKPKQKIIAKSQQELEELINNFMKENGEIKEVKKYCYGKVYYAELIL